MEIISITHIVLVNIPISYKEVVKNIRQITEQAMIHKYANNVNIYISYIHQIVGIKQRFCVGPVGGTCNNPNESFLD